MISLVIISLKNKILIMIERHDTPGKRVLRLLLLEKLENISAFLCLIDDVDPVCLVQNSLQLLGAAAGVIFIPASASEAVL